VPRRILDVIPEPGQDTRAVLRHQPGWLERFLPDVLASRLVPSPGPFFTGDGPLDLLCGQCGATLASGMEEGRVQDVVFQCPRCGAFNDTG
jgi:hypothetical protein